MNKFYILPNGTRLLAKDIVRVGLKMDSSIENKSKIAGVTVYSTMTGGTECADVLLCDSPQEAKLLLKLIVQELEAIHKDRL